MTISDLTVEDVAKYLRVELDTDDAEAYSAETLALSLAMPAAEAYMVQYTGRDLDFIKSKDDLVYPYLVFCGEIYENRQERLTTGQYKNDFVYRIMDSYAVNFLPGEAELIRSENG